jgi:hypothetical protein
VVSSAAMDRDVADALAASVLGRLPTEVVDH